MSNLRAALFALSCLVIARAACAADIAVAGADGRIHSPLIARGQKATVLVFLMRDCPVCNAMAPELARVAGDFGSRGVNFFRVYVSESAAEVQAHGKECGLSIPGLLDPELKLAKFAKAMRAPEAAVIGQDGTLLYRGRIDDRAVKAGVMRPTATRHDLRLALEAVLAGRKPDPQFTPAIGCYLPSK